MSENNPKVEDVEKIFSKLETISKNIKLYEIMTLFYLKIKKIAKAKKYYRALKEMDKTNEYLDKIENYFSKRKTKRYMFLSFFSIFMLVLITLTLTKLNRMNIIKNKEIEKVPIEIEKEKIIYVDTTSFLSNDEIYNLGLKRYKEENYQEAVKLLERVNLELLPEYKVKEVIFLKALSYNILDDKVKADENYNLFIENYSNYKEYVNTLEKRIKNEDNINEIIKNIIEFMWKEYGVIIVFSNEKLIEKTQLAFYKSMIIEKREKLDIIKVNLENIHDYKKELGIDETKLFVLLHEISHFLLLKAKYKQQEIYADLIAYFIIQELISKENFINIISNISELIDFKNFSKINESISEDLKDISKLFIYKYKKFLKINK